MLAFSLTANGAYSLEIVMTTASNVQKRVTYSSFEVGDEASGFQLRVGGFSNEGHADVQDSLSLHCNNKLFIWPGDGDPEKKSLERTFFGW